MRLPLRRTLNPNHNQVCQTAHLWVIQSREDGQSKRCQILKEDAGRNRASQLYLLLDGKCFMSRKLAKPVASAFRKQRQGAGEHQASLGSTVRSVSRTKRGKSQEKWSSERRADFPRAY